MEEILKYVQTIMYDTDIEGYEEDFSGTCFPIYWTKKLFIVTAKHCILNKSLLSEDLSRFFYPLLEEENNAVRFDTSFMMEPEIGDVEKKYQDIVILAPKIQESSIQDISRIEALDISDSFYLKDLSKFIVPISEQVELKGIVLKGFPFSKKSIDYGDTAVTRLQGIRLEDCQRVRESSHRNCYYIKFLDSIFFEPNNDADPGNGLSGSASLF